MQQSASSRAHRSALAVDFAPDAIADRLNCCGRAFGVLRRLCAIFSESVVYVSDISLYPCETIALVEPVAIVFVVSAPQETEFIETEHDSEHHAQRAGDIADSHAVRHIDHNGRRLLDLFGHVSLSPGAWVVSCDDAAHKIVSHIIERSHEQSDCTIRQRLHKSRPWFD